MSTTDTEASQVKPSIEYVANDQDVDPEDIFYAQWGHELRKNEITLANDALQRLITLNTAIIGGSMFFQSAIVISVGARWIASTLFLVSLGISLWGISPQRRHIWTCDPDEVRNATVTAKGTKNICLLAAMFFFFLGLITIVFGTLRGVVDPPATMTK